MRYLVLATAGVLLAAALAVPVSALTIEQALGGFTGQVIMKFTAWDTGTIYNVPNGTYVGETTMDGEPRFTGPTAGQPDEDSWGVAQLLSISDSANHTLWNRFLPNTPIVTAMFFGEDDTFLYQTGTGSGVSQDIAGTGMEVAFFQNPAIPGTTDLDPTTGAGASARTGPASFPGFTDGTCIWTLNSVPGYNGFPVSEDPNALTDEYFSTFNPNVAPTFQDSSGGFDAQTGTISTGGSSTLTGVDNKMFVSNPSWAITFHGNPSAGGFDVIANDPITAQTQGVPEPITLSALLLGLGGLVRYTRKRGQ